jgi:hypothetical protein
MGALKGRPKPEGSGRQKGTPASNQKFPGVAKTKVVRVPASFNEVSAVANLEQLRVLVETWQQQAEEAARVSKTQQVPRTYDKALLLLEELSQMLPTSSATR